MLTAIFFYVCGVATGVIYKNVILTLKTRTEAAAKAAQSAFKSQ